MMVAQQDSLETAYGELSALLAEDSLPVVPTVAWKGYTTVDTLHPGECYIMPFPDDSLEEETACIDLPAMLERTYFSQRDPLLPTGLPYRSMGVVGTPVPYTVRADNTLTILLLLCFVMFIVSVAHSKHFLLKQLKDFFWFSQPANAGSEGSGELRFMVFLSLVNVLVLSVSSYLLATDSVAQAIVARAGVTFVAISFAAFTAYFFLKWMAGTLVNTVFFGVKKNLQWMTLQLQVAALQGVLLFPMLALQIYFDFSGENAIIYICFVLFLNKILTFYKTFQIFFQGNGLYLQTFLYFCALEIAPLLAFYGAGLAIIDFVKVNF